MSNFLYYGDNLDVLRKHIRDETVNLCYIDPPFNSERTYNQIYNNIGGEDRAQAQAFVDTWTWDDHAIYCYEQILSNANGVQTRQSIELIRGLEAVLDKGSLFAYLVNMTVRVAEIFRKLKRTGSFYLHCDPTAVHYLKLICDAVFVPQGGDFRNDVIWCYRKWSINQKQFVSNHDNILFYTKSEENAFNVLYVPLSAGTIKRWKGKKQQAVFDDSGRRLADSLEQESQGSPMSDWWEISIINPAARERLGYPTQKPEALLERIIKASSNEGDIVLDAYCGCGTTIAVAQRLGRRWIGIDITYQSISLILKRLTDTFGKAALNDVVQDGVPRDMKSAIALAHRKDDRLRKEFEKWAVLTYTENRGVISDKKGADRGIDGVAYTGTGKDESARIVFQVKSGHVGRGDVAKLRGDMSREEAEMAVLITLEEPTAPMIKEAKAAGKYQHPLMDRSYDTIQIVTVREIVEEGRRLEVPLSREVLKAARADAQGEQLALLDE